MPRAGVQLLTPARLLRLMVELIFLLLGGIVVWLGLTGHIFFDRRKPAWILLAVVLVVWGLRAIVRPDRQSSSAESWIRALSLVLLGVAMLLIWRVPFSWVGPLLAAGGAALALRGLVNTILALRPR
jgi:hypothetical protein